MQLAAPSVILDAIHLLPGWPSIESQEQLCSLLMIDHREKFPSPAKGWKQLFNSIERDITASNEIFSNTLMELIVESQTRVLDGDDMGYLSFFNLAKDNIITIQVVRAHNQVGMKVWGAGIYLGELLQRVPQLLAGKTVVELGAGVGITGLLLGRGIPPALQPYKIIMTDFHTEIVELLRNNISINDTDIAADNVVPAQHQCLLEADVVDWGGVQESDFIIYSATVMLVADCTYSEIGNHHLVRAFKCYLHAMSIGYRKYGANDENILVVVPADESVTTASGGASTTAQLSCVQHLLNTDTPLILIACPVRSEETYLHFRNLVDCDCELTVVDVTDWAASCFPAQPLYYYSEDRSRIKLLCIYLK